MTNRVSRSARQAASSTAARIDMDYPFAGDWLVQNSPANRVPSHGTHLFGAAFAIDFVPVSRTRHTAPLSLRSLVRAEAASSFPGFGRPILAPVDGVVVLAHDSEPDHDAYRGLPSIGYGLTQRRRAVAGWRGLAGNHIVIENDGVLVALCHLQQGSVQVRVGERVARGAELARCGNSGNSTEPHLHVQANGSGDIARADAVPLSFNGSIPVNGEIVHI